MKISTSLSRTRAATFAVTVPNPQKMNFPTPVGTGFLVSADGWFVTAAHVLTVFDKNRKTPATTVGGSKEARFDGTPYAPMLLTSMELKHFDQDNDFALLKADFSKHANMEWLKAREGFPYVPISTTVLDEGDDVYSFGYPLSRGHLHYPGPEVIVGGTELHPRVTSAIIASHYEKVGMMMRGGPQQTYVLDKALNYGNSGGPIIANSTGYAHAFCSRFQPVFVPQMHLGENVQVMIPSLYGVVTSFSYLPLSQALHHAGIETSAST